MINKILNGHTYRDVTHKTLVPISTLWTRYCSKVDNLKLILNQKLGSLKCIEISSDNLNK